MGLKGSGNNSVEVLYRHLSRYIEENHKNLSQNNGCLKRDSKRTSVQYFFLSVNAT
jgi:hypothetical protein